MGKAFVRVGVIIALTCVPQGALAWGTVGHRLIMRRAIELLPPEIKPFFVEFRDELVMRVVDPDQWRNLGWPDDANHFLDLGVPEYGAYPFDALPRDHGAALEKFGEVVLRRNGLLPWREQEMFGNLRRSFEGLARNRPYARNDVVLFSAVAAHYIQDAHQPLHATGNFDGAATGNRGIHARFESELIERFQSRLRLAPGVPVAITAPRDTAFTVLLASYQLVDGLIKADTEAIAGKDEYDAEYYEKFFTRVQPVIEQRLSESISATAGLIIGAWEQAGKPAMSIREARPVEKVRPAPGR